MTTSASVMSGYNNRIYIRMENAMEVISILLLVLAAGINYPVLADFGIILGQLLTLVVDSDRRILQ